MKLFIMSIVFIVSSFSIKINAAAIQKPAPPAVQSVQRFYTLYYSEPGGKIMIYNGAGATAQAAKEDAIGRCVAANFASTRNCHRAGSTGASSYIQPVHDFRSRQLIDR